MAFATASLLGLVSTQALALALGRIDVLSALGEPLQAEIDLPGISEDEAATLKTYLAGPDTFRAAGLIYLPGLNNLQITLHKRDSRTYLLLRGDSPIASPYVDLIVEAQWAAGRIVRGYTVLLPPPRQPQPAPAVTTTPQITPAAESPAPAPQIPPASEAPPPPPAPRASVADSASPVTPARITVKYGDTAGRIAQANLPATVSLDQMLIALLQANPQAFVNGNVNRLKAGAVLDIPSAEQVQAIDDQRARSMVRAQSRDFNEYRRKLAGMTPQAPAKSMDRQTGGTIEARVEDKKPAADAADKLTLSKGAVKGKTREDELSHQGNQKEAERQASELAKNIEELKKLSAEIVQAAAAPASAPASAASTASPAGPAIVAETPQVAASAPASAPAAAASAASEPASTPAPAASVAPSPKASIIDQLVASPMISVAAGALLALLTALGIYRARRRNKSEGTSFQETLNESMSAAPTQALAGSSEETEAEAAPSDPVAEADAFLAYGREQQAEDILREGLLSEPDRLAIHEKLLEIYAKRLDTVNFEEIARQVRRITGGDGPHWDQACALGISIDPDNPLYHRSQDSAQAEAMPPVEPPPPSEFDESTYEEAPAAEVEPPARPQIELPIPSDLDLSLDKPASTTVDVEVPGEQMAPPAMPEPDLSAADLDLDLEALKQDRAPAPTKPAEPQPTDFDLNSIDLDLGTPAQPEPAPDNPLSIKMALAEEFSAIGDTDGARSLLEEVIAEADGELRAKAEEALQKLG